MAILIYALPGHGGLLMDVEERIRHARTLLDAGSEKAAARELTDAVVVCDDAAQAMEIRRLADRGLDIAGRFGKPRWREVARLADIHAARART